MVGRNGQIRVILESSNNIQIGHAWLDHEHVRAFGLVESGFDQGLATIGWVLLVGLFIPKAWVGIEGVAERTVVGRCVFGSVGEDRNVSETFRVERVANGLDATVL